MPQTRNPTAKGDRASCVLLGGATHEAFTLSTYRAQHVIAAYGVRPQLAAVVAALAFGGGDHG